MTNFQDCKVVMIKYLWEQITKEELIAWAIEHCENCTEKACHCADCPIIYEGECRFPI